MHRFCKNSTIPFRMLRRSWSQAREAHSTSSESPLVLQIWGANTGVGKTVLSAALLRQAQGPSLYLKPVQSGYPNDDDSKVVESHAPHARGVTLHAYGPAVSPDLAASLDQKDPVSDNKLCEQTVSGLGDFIGVRELDHQSSARVLVLVETAGGVLSPAPSGTLQADLYRPLRLPALLLGDSRLGGVSTTIAAYEALRIRGYDIPAIIFFAEEDSELENEASVERHVEKDNTSVFQAPHLPPRDVPLAEYFRAPNVDQFFSNLCKHLRAKDEKRFRDLKDMQEESKNVFWYPFTQHRKLDKITCIDSASGDNFTCYDSEQGLYNMVDGIGSWWTNGVGHGNVEVSKAIGRACGRYGHVMFAEATNEPAFKLAKLLLEGPGKGWAERVFYSDDGSTAVEVALKMAFRKRAQDFPDRAGLPVRIVGIEGCYHGDTLGVMDCAPCSDYNRSQTPWYEPRGLFFEPPTAAICNGVWRVSMPESTGAEYDIVLPNEDELFDKSRRVARYEDGIAKRLDDALGSGVELGALLLEPVVLGAGGMRMVDPAFQRALVTACRQRDVPVIFDEVFTGIWRLGALSGAELLGVQPDIATFGKLLTGGTVPIAATLASGKVFNAFDGQGKVEALLHGHSYTGHAAGCAAGLESFRQYGALKKGQVYWDSQLAREISCLEGVADVSVIGTILAVRLDGQGGYAAEGADKVVGRLRDMDVFVRPLGNIIYVMCAPITSEAVCENIMRKLFTALLRTETAEVAGRGRGEAEQALE